MGTIRIIVPGLFSTMQDLGRSGFGASGVPRGGAADSVSLELGNRVLGNAPGAPAIEMTLTGLTCEFASASAFAVSGARVRGWIDRDGAPAREWTDRTRVPVLAGDTVRFGRFEAGCRAYLCVAGGFTVPRLLGSGSTLVSGGFGGHEGRALRAGDQLSTGAPGPAGAGLTAPGVSLADELLSRRILRAVPGPHYKRFSADAVERFWSSPFGMAEQSDRVGIRLSGPAIAVPDEGRMASEGVMWGAVQVPADGQPIVLMCDHPTTGGYPVIACVASVDLPVLGQLRPRDAVRFEPITVERAWELKRDRAREVARAVSP